MTQQPDDPSTLPYQGVPVAFDRDREHLRILSICWYVFAGLAALMGSIPVHNAGIASAINNALSRVGQPLVGAAVFIVVSGAFYATLAAAVPGTDPGSPELRAQYEAFHPPPKDAPAALAAAAKVASTDAFHLAMLVGATLMVSGAVVNAVGLRPSSSARAEAAATSKSISGSTAQGG